MPASTGKSKLAFIQEKNKKFIVPEDELKWIDPDSRQKLFIDLCNRYTSRYNPEDLRIIYSALNYNSEDMVDYLIIFNCGMIRKTDNDQVIRDDFIGFINPFIYTNLTIPGYRYALRQQKALQEDIKSGKIKREDIKTTPLDNFFTDSIADINKLEASKFYNEFIPGMLKLSNVKELVKTNKDGTQTKIPNPEYWKDPKNVKQVIHTMMNYSLYFNS